MAAFDWTVRWRHFHANSHRPKIPQFVNFQVLQNQGELSFVDASISVDLFTKENFPQEFEDDIFDE